MPSFGDSMNSVLGLTDYVQGQYQQGVERKRRNSLADLMGQAASGGPVDAQGIARNGGDPFAVQGSVDKMQDRELQEAGRVAAYLKSVGPQNRPQAFASMRGRLEPFARKHGLPLPEVWDEAHVSELDGLIQYSGIGGKPSDLPAEVRTALYFKEHPELIEQERQRYKDRPFYDPTSGQMIYPNPGGPAPRVVQAGDTASQRAYDIETGKGRGQFDADVARAPFDVSHEGAKAEASAAGKVAGERGATAAADLPKMEAGATEALGTLDRVLNHPGFKTATGLRGAVDFLNKIPGSQGTDFRALIGQVKGKAFLEAFNSLRGGGQITEVEGQKATDAITALGLEQSPEQLRENLMILKGIVQKGIERARQQARKGATSAPAGDPLPQPGTMEDGYRFKGGDPSDPNNWEQM